jgi:hypothetical protein
MSERDDFDDAVKRMGAPPMGHLELCVRPGLGSRSLYWESFSRAGAVPAAKWKSLRDAALAREHAKFNAPDLDGSMVGEAFLNCVIRDPKVQATGAWLCLERPVFREVFTEGMFPNNVRRAERSSQTVQGSWNPLAEPAVREWDHTWPVVLDATKLIEILSTEYDVNANYAHDPTEGPIYHAATALADRHQAFFDLLRSRLLVAEGTFKDTGQELSIPTTQWLRRDRRLDVRNSDVLNNEGEAAEAKWESVTLRLPYLEVTAGNSSKAANVTFPLPTSASPLSRSAEDDASGLSPPLKRVRNAMVASRVEEAMKRDISEGRQTPGSLTNMLEKHMEAQYRASRDTCRKARKKVLSEIVARQIATNDK